MKATGMVTFRMESVLTITPMETYTRVNGLEANKTEKVTIYTMAIKVFIRVIGKTARKKVLVSS